MPADIRLGLGRATRITVYREKLEDIILPPSALTAEVQKVFRPNRSTSESVHGPVGTANLVLLVPKGKRVTVIKGKQVRACGLQASIGFIESTCEEVADIEGDVELFDSAQYPRQTLPALLPTPRHEMGGRRGSRHMPCGSRLSSGGYSRRRGY